MRRGGFWWGAGGEFGEVGEEMSVTSEVEGDGGSWKRVRNNALLEFGVLELGVIDAPEETDEVQGAVSPGEEGLWKEPVSLRGVPQAVQKRSCGSTIALHWRQASLPWCTPHFVQKWSS